MSNRLIIEFRGTILPETSEELEDRIANLLSQERVIGEIYSEITGNNTQFYHGRAIKTPT
jgi:hypothetical protein